LEAIRLQTEVEPFTPEIAEHYADIYAELSHAGSLVPQNDSCAFAPLDFDCSKYYKFVK